MHIGNLDEAVIAFTLEEITWCNEKAAGLLGYITPDHLVGREPFELVSDEHYFDLMMGAKTSLSTGKSNSILCTLIHREDNLVPCLIRYAYSIEECAFIAIIRPLMKDNAEENVVRFLELVRSNINVPDSVIEGNTDLINRMNLNKSMLAESLGEIKRNIEDMRRTSNLIRESIPTYG